MSYQPTRQSSHREADELSVARSLLRTRHAEEDLTYQLMSMVHEKVLLEK